MKMGRTLFPHKKLPDAVYALLAKDLDAQGRRRRRHRHAAAATASPALDKAAGGSFAKAERRQAAGDRQGDRRHALLRRGARPVHHLAVRQRHGLQGLRLPRLGLGEGRLHHARLPGPEVAAGAAHEAEPASPAAAEPTDTRTQETAMAKFDMNDDSVVVIIGSGAGGGTLANELCQKGIKVVVLEAGARAEHRQLHQRRVEVLRPAGLAGPAHHLAAPGACEGLRRPAGLDLQDRGRHHHALGRRLAALPGARVQGQDASTATSPAPTWRTGRSRWPELEPWYAKAEDKMGVTRTNGIPGLPGNNNFKVFHAGATKLGYKEVHTGNMAINSEPRHGRGRCMQLGFCFQGCKSGAKWSTLYTETAQGREDRQPGPAPRSPRDAHRAQRQRARSPASSTSTRTARNSARRPASSAWPATRSRRRACCCCRLRTMFKDGLANQSGQVGRNYMRHMTGSVYAAFKQPGAHVPRHHDGRHRARRGRATTRSAASPAATSWKRSRWASPSWPPS